MQQIGNPLPHIEHYPVESWHKDAIEEINTLLGLPEDTEWWHTATTQGRLFWTSGEKRLYKQHLQGLLEINGFRWIEFHHGMMVGLEHKNPA